MSGARRRAPGFACDVPDSACGAPDLACGAPASPRLRSVLSVAGSDSSGGAGIQADIKTIEAMGLFAQTAVTALTAQNTTGVLAVAATEPDMVAAQIDAVFADIVPDAVKIGMVPSGDAAREIAERLCSHGARNIVVDPVMVATSGAALADGGSVAVEAVELFGMATVVTPNIPEAEALLGLIGSGGGGLANGVAKKGGPLECGDGTGSGGLADNWGNVAGERDVASGRNAVKITSEADAEAAARALAEHFGCAFLVKGGHGAHDANDVLAAAEGGVRWFRSERVDNPNTHGTGCTLSSAIACGLARGLDLGDAVVAAKDYLTGCLRAGLDLGRGSGPLDHMWAYRHRR